MSDDRTKPQPWLCLWRAETGSFAQLPLVARALFAEILKLTDDHGEIYLGEKAPHDAVAFALGADASDRRALRKYLPVLLSDGCIQVADGVMSFPGWVRFQPPTKVSKKPRSRREPTTNSERTDNEPITSGARTDNESKAKYAESYDGTDRALNCIRVEREGDTREREESPPKSKSRLGRSPPNLGRFVNLVEPDGAEVSSLEFVLRAWEAETRAMRLPATGSALRGDRMRLEELHEMAAELAFEQAPDDAGRRFGNLVVGAIRAYRRRFEEDRSGRLKWRAGYVVGDWAKLASEAA